MEVQGTSVPNLLTRSKVGRVLLQVQVQVQILELPSHHLKAQPLPPARAPFSSPTSSIAAWWPPAQKVHCHYFALDHREQSSFAPGTHCAAHDTVCFFPCQDSLGRTFCPREHLHRPASLPIRPPARPPLVAACSRTRDHPRSHFARDHKAVSSRPSLPHFSSHPPSLPSIIPLLDLIPGT